MNSVVIVCLAFVCLPCQFAFRNFNAAKTPQEESSGNVWIFFAEKSCIELGQIFLIHAKKRKTDSWRKFALSEKLRNQCVVIFNSAQRMSNRKRTSCLLPRFLLRWIFTVRTWPSTSTLTMFLSTNCIQTTGLHFFLVFVAR